MTAALPRPAHAQAADCDRPVTVPENKFPLLGLRAGSPLRASVYGGWWWRVGRNTQCLDNAVTVTAEPGLGGGQVSVGFLHGRSSSPDGSGGRSWRPQLSLLRTWGRPLTARRDRTYAGAELQYPLVPLVGGRVGMFWQADGGADAHRFVAASVVLGF